MKLNKRISMFISLFFNINKNYFFERYKFLQLKDKNKKILFTFWYIFKSQVFIIGSVLILQFLFKSDMLNTIVIILLLFSMMLGMDAKEWRLFYRFDFVSEIPDIKQRFLTVLLGNVVLKLFVENSLILLSLLLLIYTHISLFYLPLFLIIYIVVYASSLSLFFIIQSSPFRIKKIFSLINYIISFLFTVTFIYLLLDFVITIFITFSNNLDNRNILPTFINQGISVVKNLAMFIINNNIIALVLIVVYVMVVLLLNIFTIKYLEKSSYLDKEDSVYIVDNFIIVKLIKKILSILYRNKPTRLVLINKEFALFTHIYKYNFKDYFFIFIADRSMSFLISIFLIISKYEYSASSLIILLIVPIILLVDINSNVGVKLITNMSFITDYNTLLCSNASGFDLNKLIKSKLSFYFSVKSGAYIIFILVYNFMYISLNMPLYMIIIGNLLNLVVLNFFPKLYFTNNLIYSRMNYKNYQKYLDESKILDFGVSEFYPLNLIFKIWIIIVFFVLIFTTIIPIVNINILLLISLLVILISILIVYLIMNKINKNIIHFIERGNYSADFAKIFKE